MVLIYLFFFIGALYVLFFIHHFFLFRFRFVFNEADLHMYFGLPGSGKSTVCADIVRQITSVSSRSKLSSVVPFTNFPVRNAFRLDRDMIGNYDFVTPECTGAVLLLDEASTVYMKRDAMTRKKDGSLKFGESENKFHSMHRHYHTMEVCFAQSWDGVDLRLRELSTGLFYVEKSRIWGFIKVRRISKIFAINEDHQPVDGYDFVKWSSRYVWARRAWKLFDTYEAPELLKIQPEYWYDSDDPAR